jgi:hypothetical protein
MTKMGLRFSEIFSIDSNRRVEHILQNVWDKPSCWSDVILQHLQYAQSTSSNRHICNYKIVIPSNFVMKDDSQKLRQTSNYMGAGHFQLSAFLEKKGERHFMVYVLKPSVSSPLGRRL